jgi:hypothetical protein
MKGIGKNFIMECKHHHWSIKTLVEKKDKINQQPQWQRGDTWKTDRQQLLIDSTLLGFDIPKIYLWKTNNDSMCDYAVADGQQRLRAIWGFIEDKYGLFKSEGKPWYGLPFSKLSKEHHDQILAFKVAITEVEASPAEIRELFARLQRGVALTPAQIRNSLPSAIGDVIRAMALNHKFMMNSPITADGFKRDDYLAHAFVLQLKGGACDLKAHDLNELYKTYSSSVSPKIITQVTAVLDYMDRMQTQVPRVINTKWGFADVFWAVSSNLSDLPDASLVARRYAAFEVRRKSFVSDSSSLSDSNSPNFDKDLYDYIAAFKTSGGTSRNVGTRHRVLVKKLGFKHA